MCKYVRKSSFEFHFVWILIISQEGGESCKIGERILQHPPIQITKFATFNYEWGLIIY